MSYGGTGFETLPFADENAPIAPLSIEVPDVDETLGPETFTPVDLDSLFLAPGDTLAGYIERRERAAELVPDVSTTANSETVGSRDESDPVIDDLRAAYANQRNRVYVAVRNTFAFQSTPLFATNIDTKAYVPGTDVVIDYELQRLGLRPRTRSGMDENLYSLKQSDVDILRRDHKLTLSGSAHKVFKALRIGVKTGYMDVIVSELSGRTVNARTDSMPFNLKAYAKLNDEKTFWDTCVEMCAGDDFVFNTDGLIINNRPELPRNMSCTISIRHLKRVPLDLDLFSINDICQGAVVESDEGVGLISF